MQMNYLVLLVDFWACSMHPILPITFVRHTCQEQEQTAVEH